MPGVLHSGKPKRVRWGEVPSLACVLSAASTQANADGQSASWRQIVGPGASTSVRSSGTGDGSLIAGSKACPQPETQATTMTRQPNATETLVGKSHALVKGTPHHDWPSRARPPASRIAWARIIPCGTTSEYSLGLVRNAVVSVISPVTSSACAVEVVNEVRQLTATSRARPSACLRTRRRSL